MTAEKKSIRWKLKARETRMLLYLLVVLGVVGWKFIPRPWHPTITFEGTHHTIYSSATRQQTEDTAHAMELLYKAYSNRFQTLKDIQSDHPKLKVNLFKDRAEFRRINPGLGWAEAYYRESYCRAYFSSGEINPYHWMLHESVHQLTHEVAHLKLAKWLEERLVRRRPARTTIRTDQIDVRRRRKRKARGVLIRREIGRSTCPRHCPESDAPYFPCKHQPRCRNNG
ncbi:MAG: hypothetical protein HY298_03380 [Verrucomicrobia bacterium]|nr:hypothetical protein [Verrucomicrobiota bacterium]